MSVCGHKTTVFDVTGLPVKTFTVSPSMQRIKSSQLKWLTVPTVILEDIHLS